jgi:hypothetical protein
MISTTIPVRPSVRHSSLRVCLNHLFSTYRGPASNPADGIECRLENRIVKFEIWDTAGQGTLLVFPVRQSADR